VPLPKSQSGSGAGLRVVSTAVYEEFEVLRGVNAATKTDNPGDQAAAEVLSKELEQRDRVILILDDSNAQRQKFSVDCPMRL